MAIFRVGNVNIVKINYRKKFFIAERFGEITKCHLSLIHKLLDAHSYNVEKLTFVS